MTRSPLGHSTPSTSPGPRCRDDVHALRRPRLPDVRRRGQGRSADADPRRASRADRRVRRRGDRQADPHARPRRAHRRPGRHQRRQRHHPGPVQRLPLVVVGGRAPANRWGTGSPPGARPAADHRAGHQARPARCTPPPRSPPGSTRRSPLAGASHRGPVFVDVPMDEFFDVTDAETPAVTPRHRGSSPTPTPSPRSPSCSGRPSGPVLVIGTDVWADGAEEAALRLVEEPRPPRDHQRHGPRRRPRRAPAARHQGARRRRSAAPTWSSSSAPRWTSGSATASSAARTAPRRPGSCTSPTPRTRSPGTPTLAGSASGDLTLVLDGLARGRRPVWSADPTGRLGRRAAGHRRGGRRARRRPCSAPRPTRSTRPGSTASCCPGWPTTPS